MAKKIGISFGAAFFGDPKEEKNGRN